MKITEVKSLAIEGCKVIKYQRFADERGFFAESYRKQDLDIHPETEILRDMHFTQMNESYSKAGTIRGMHFQWNPFMAKLVRCISGRMIDLLLDVRKDSPTFGNIIGYDSTSSVDNHFGEWVYAPVGIAHGVFLPENTLIEYYCTGFWNPECETGISPLAGDIDWSKCDSEIMELIHRTVNSGKLIIKDKDRDAHTIESWSKLPESDLFKI
ncbi:MAG: dTDP-4-dehydrorhamnose 3,5-epimerase family protein [Candidatus Kapabacteria bacterium]|nr:dTDP-4-dehydrorhamnose 3,5-epimerase family protein [Ignavibacteriota bacterium]MCW5884610.1 dTDP-4-dehydrorhamnose 3,5-epimerase family protein [Candidatus Kapabacteria bacterium]